MILADTHVLVWLASGDSRLPPEFRQQIEGGERLSTSAVVAFEYCELFRQGRLGECAPFTQAVDALDLTVMPLPAEVWEVAESLPPIHRDPIDRMLVAHGIASGAAIATADHNMRRYPVSLAW